MLDFSEFKGITIGGRAAHVVCVLSSNAPSNLILHQDILRERSYDDKDGI